MNILILGGGGRESTFAWKIAQSPLCDQLFIAPGNAGTSTYGTNVALGVTDFDSIRDYCVDHNVAMIVVGPELPLVEGIYDYFAPTDIQVVGPSKAAAQLEGSKAFAKGFMARHGVPTAGYVEVTTDNLQAGIDHILSQPGPYVLKADGLAAGKGVLIIEDRDEAVASLKEMLDGQFGAASAKVVIEDFLDGIEFSVFVLTDGRSYQILPIAKDYKRIGEGDTGLNTGGMGAVSPVPFVDAEMMRKVEEYVVVPTVAGSFVEGMDYEGFIFLGLINVGGEPYVIEYNCRMGDPETEVVFARIASDIVPALASLKDQTLQAHPLQVDSRSAATVMLVSGGYPGKYEKGKVITNIDEVTDSIVFHAGTRQDGDEVVTNGGRVLAVTSFGPDIATAVDKSLSAAAVIDFEGKYYRKDIGKDLM
jgi:phosphoribosylamine--glycine ligase